MASDQQHTDAVVAAYLALGALPYDLGNVPGNRPEKYTEITVTRRFGGEQRSSGERDGQLWRITARQVGRVFQNAQNLRAKGSAIEGAVLTIAGGTSTPVEFETAEVIGPDDGWFSGLETWTYALI